jgi:hypothetical protein
MAKKEIQDGPRPRNMPWHQYQQERDWRLLVPGWGGNLDDAELAYIVEHLKNDDALRLWWGMRPSWKRIPEEVVRRVAVEGTDETLAHNRKLARRRKKAQDPGQDAEAA